MLSSIHGVILAVRDLEVAQRRYTDLLGQEPSRREVDAECGTERCRYQLANTGVELVAPLGKGAWGGKLAERLEGLGEGLWGMAFGTQDVPTTLAALRRRGVAATGPVKNEARESTTGTLRRRLSVDLPPEVTRGLWLSVVEGESPNRTPAHDGGLGPSAADGLGPSSADGLGPSSADGLGPSSGGGLGPSSADGLGPSSADGLRPSAADGLRPSAADGGRVSAVDHVVISSAAPDTSKALYGDQLGLRLALDRSFPERGVRLLFFRTGGVTVEIASRLDQEPRPQVPDRFFGLAYQVGDAEAARNRLVAAGFHVSKVRPGHKPGTRVFTVHGETHGIPTLFIQPVAAGPPKLSS